MPDEKEKGEKVIRGQAVDDSVKLVTSYHNQIAPTIEPERVERPWVLELSGYPYDLAGRIDLDERVSEEIPSGRIRDWKTRKVSPPAGAADSSLQLSVYAMAKWKLDGMIPLVSLDFIINLKKGAKVVVQPSERTKKHFQVVLRHFESMINALEKGIFLPTNPDNWWCSERFCGYWSTCKYTHH